MLKLENISYEIQEEKGQKGIIHHVDLTINDNEFVVITGPNGGGKSTLAKLIAGIINPTGGRILFNGEDITGKSITERANMGISFAFQQPVRFKGVQVLDLIISHQERILNIADRIVVIADGRVIKEGRKDEILPEILGTSSAVEACDFYRRDN